MAKKVLFIGEMPKNGAKEALAKLCGISVEKFDTLFDYCTLFTKEVMWFPKDAAMRATMLLRETPHPMLVLDGLRVAEAFGVTAQPLFETFALGDGEGEEADRMFAVLKIAPAKDRFYRKESHRRLAKTVMRLLVTMCQVPATPDEANVCCQTVRNALGDNMSLWTRKHVEDCERKLANGETVDNHDLAQLMASYANDVKQWVRPGGNE
jgi:hypothetical protein